MFPISDSHKSHKFPFVTLVIIAINVFVFFIEITSPDQEAFIREYALTPANINFLNPMTLTTFITSLFLHGGFFHILSNMWFLWIFGDNVETHIGKVKFLFLYIFAGILGSLVQYFFIPSSTIPMLGASGAVSGILASYMVFFPTSKIKTIVIFFLAVSVVQIPAFIYIFYWFLIQFISGIISIPLTIGGAGGVAFWAHVGGFVGGFWLAKRFKKDEVKPGVIEGEIVE